MAQELIGELFRRYMRGELALENAAEQIFALTHGGQNEVVGLSMDTGDMTAADQERAFALFGRLKWQALREALPGTDIPPIGAQDFLAGLDEAAEEDDIDS